MREVTLQGLGLLVQGLRSGVWGSGFEVKGFKDWGLGFAVWSFRSRGWGQSLGFGF
jgi:hypothetical protein